MMAAADRFCNLLTVFMFGKNMLPIYLVEMPSFKQMCIFLTSRIQSPWKYFQCDFWIMIPNPQPWTQVNILVGLHSQHPQLNLGCWLSVPLQLLGWCETQLHFWHSCRSRPSSILIIIWPPPSSSNWPSLLHMILKKNGDCKHQRLFWCHHPLSQAYLDLLVDTPCNKPVSSSETFTLHLPTGTTAEIISHRVTNS